MPDLTELNDISIAQICVYVPALAVAIILASRHGFGRSSGWFYLIAFSLSRIIGSGMQLGTINDPTNLSLIVGASTLQGVGLSGLILVMLGLLSRVLDSIRQERDTLVTPRHVKAVQVVVLVGLILGVVGGSQSGSSISDALQHGRTNYAVPAVTQAGQGLIIAGFAIVAAATVLTGLQVRAAAPGEKRLLLANALVLPFLLVRVVYAGVAAFGTDPNFRSIGGRRPAVDYLLGMSVVMEMVSVAVFEVIGLTVQKARVPDKESAIPMGTPVRQSA